MSAAICLAAARTIMYPHGGGHLWVYLQWALSLLALGWRVIWLEGIDPGDPERDPRELATTLKQRLKPYGLADSVALCSLTDEPLPPDVTEHAMDLDAASEADLLLNLWHSLPASVVSRFRRAAFVDTDPGLLQIWMTRGDVQVASHHLYFTIGETVGTSAARFPDCGLRWLYTPPPVFLPAWPTVSVDATAPYTTVTHWWGSRFEFGGQIINEEKHVSFLEYKELPSRICASLELAICLGEHCDSTRATAASFRMLGGSFASETWTRRCRHFPPWSRTTSVTPGSHASSPRSTSTAAMSSPASWSRLWISGRAGRPARGGLAA